MASSSELAVHCPFFREPGAGATPQQRTQAFCGPLRLGWVNRQVVGEQPARSFFRLYGGPIFSLLARFQVALCFWFRRFCVGCCIPGMW